MDDPSSWRCVGCAARPDRVDASGRQMYNAYLAQLPIDPSRAFNVVTILLPLLPMDVHALIIDQLHDDKVSLATCSLVCRSWHHVAQSNLFRKISIDPAIGGNISGYLGGFISILKSSPGRVGRHVRELRLIGNRFQQDEGTSFKADTGWRVSTTSPKVGTELIRSCVSLLPRLQKLVISDVEPRCETKEWPPGDNRPQLRHLELQYTFAIKDSNDVEGIYRLLAIFSSIRTLVLNIACVGGLRTGADRTPSTIPDRQSKSPRVNVRSLVIIRLSVPWAIRFYQLLRDIEDLQDRSLKALGIWSRYGHDELAILGAFVRSSGPTVPFFYFNAAGGGITQADRRHVDNRQSLWSCLQINHCVNLRCIVFSLEDREVIRDPVHNSESVGHAFQAALDVLQLGGFQSLQRVIFHLSLKSELHPALTVPDWERMDKVLDGIRTLTTVVINFAPGSIHLTERFEERLLRVHERGLLQFRMNDTHIPWYEIPV